MSAPRSSEPQVSLAGALRLAYRLLPPAQRRVVIFLVGMMVVNGFTEVSGIAGILPVMSVAANPDAMNTTPWLHRLHQALGSPPAPRFLGELAGGFIGVFLVVNCCRAFTTWLGLRFSFNTSHALGTRLLASYMGRPYAWLRARNSAELSKDVLSEINLLVENIYIPITEICTNGLASLMIALTLLLLDPRVALGTGLGLVGMFALVYQINRNALARNGELRDRLNAERFRAVHEALYALREARLLSRRGQFLARYAGHSRNYNDALASGDLIWELPHFFTEILALTALVGALVYFSWTGQGGAVAWLGLYIMAIWRMVPSLQNLYRNLARIRFFTPALVRLAAELEVAVPPAPEGLERLPLGSGLQLEEAHFAYGERPVVQGVTLQLRRGARVALVGETGSGKTTVADMLAGLLPLQQGGLRVDGQLVGETDMPRWAASVGYVPQEIYLSDASVAENIALGFSDPDPDMVRQAARAAQLDDIVQALPEGYATRLGERGAALSGGQRQRVGLARALFARPELLILDEATSALDEATQARVLEALRALPDLTTLVIAHRSEVIRACDEVLMLSGGRVVARGTFDQLADGSPEFSALLRHGG